MTDVIGSSELDEATVAELRARLEAERDTLLHQLEQHAAGREDRPGATDSTSFGETEHLSLIEQQDVMGMLDTMSRTLLADTVRAIARIDEGTYGACVACGTAIPVERLEAMPSASYCVSCQQARESS